MAIKPTKPQKTEPAKKSAAARGEESRETKALTGNRNDSRQSKAWSNRDESRQTKGWQNRDESRQTKGWANRNESRQA